MQSELFQDLSSGERPRRLNWPAIPGRFLRIKIAYEDLVVGALSLLLLLLAGFCLGVERGKGLIEGPGTIQVPRLIAQADRNAVRETPRRPEVKPAPSQPIQKAPLVAPVLPPTSAETEEPSRPQAPRQRYVIQLASYVGVQAARNEAERLKRKGVDVRVLKQGRYYELRAIGYKTRPQAQASLVTLRKRYHDAFIKRLKTG